MFVVVVANDKGPGVKCLLVLIVIVDRWMGCVFSIFLLLILQVGVRDSSYSDFLVDLHQKEGESEDCRYGLYDYDYQFNPDGTESTFKSKLFLMSWCPDSAKIKKKMLYSSSFDTLKRAFVGVHKVIQANDKSECEQVTNLESTITVTISGIVSEVRGGYPQIN